MKRSKTLYGILIIICFIGMIWSWSMNINTDVDFAITLLLSTICAFGFAISSALFIMKLTSIRKLNYKNKGGSPL